MRQERWLRSLMSGALLLLLGAAKPEAPSESGGNENVPGVRSEADPESRPATELAVCLPGLDSVWRHGNASFNLFAR